MSQTRTTGPTALVAELVPQVDPVAQVSGSLEATWARTVDGDVMLIDAATQVQPTLANGAVRSSLAGPPREAV